MADTTVKSTAKLSYFMNLESTVQEQWKQNKLFEMNPPEHGEKDIDGKFMATFPYPYMNGRIHIGHSFSLSKLEVCALVKEKLFWIYLIVLY